MKITFSKTLRSGGWIALTAIFAIAPGCSTSSNVAPGSATTSNPPTNAATPGRTPDPAMPTDAELEALVKETMARFAAAVESGDFTGLRDYASTDFQQTYNGDELAETFKLFIDRKDVVLPILKKVVAQRPDFSEGPSIRSERSRQVLAAKGSFPTKPHTVTFDHEYIVRDGEWKLLKLKLNVP